MLLCVIGGFFGTALALTALAAGGMAIGAEGVTIAFRPSAQLAILGMTVSCGVGIVAGFFPAIQAARTPIVTALRQA
jgi:putative ABC transport system permease protein